jgi:hypothetical protein
MEHGGVVHEAEDDGISAAGEREGDGEPAELGEWGGGRRRGGIGGGRGCAVGGGGWRFDVGVDFGTSGVGEKLSAEADSQCGAVGFDHALEQGDFFFEEGVGGVGDVGDAHGAAEDDEAAEVVEVGGDFVAFIEVADFGGDAEVAEDGDDSAGGFVGDVLEDDGFAHNALE